MANYAPVAFHFKVEFFLNGLIQQDSNFQEVSGLSVTVETEDYIEGGENRFTHSLPTKSSFADLELKRGMLKNSGIIKWIKDALLKFEYQPADLLVTLLNEKHEPLTVWKIIHAFPIEWTISPFNAMESSLVIESIKLKYQYFEMRNVN